MKNKQQKRGELTRRVDDKAKECLGSAITIDEMRLMPYLQYRTMNEQTIDPRKVNDEEMAILDGWQKKGYIKLDRRSSFPRLTVSKKFHDAMSEILWLAYVDIDNDL